MTPTRAASPWGQLNWNSPPPAASTNKCLPSTAPGPAAGDLWPFSARHRCPGHAHLSFLRSPRATGLTAILGNVEAEVWDWLQADRVSMLRGDCGGVLHSECDNEPAEKGVGYRPQPCISVLQQPRCRGRHDPDTRPRHGHIALEFRCWVPQGLSIPHLKGQDWTQSVFMDWLE